MVSTPWVLVLAGAVVTSAMMTGLWLLQRARRDAGWVDVGWSYGIGILAVLYAIAGDGDPARRGLVGALGAVWSLRLGTYILANRVIGKPEDSRYQTLRASWGERAQPYFFLFFQAQALLDVLFAVPLLVAMRKPGAPFDGFDLAGVAVWLVAVGGETIADRQLARHRADPALRGRTCRSGLWRFSRHPNYFFEFLHWWAYVALAAGAPAWWLALLGPAVMAFFLLKVTGIPATEAQALKSRTDYAEYRRTTSAFIPWPPRSSDVRR
jgi:steroid 5-alpha reductase family enzyme